MVLVGIVLLWPAPYMSALRSPNELVRVYLTRALVDGGTVTIDAQVRTYGPLADLARREGMTYSDKAPGLSLLSVPVYAAARLVWEPDAISNRDLMWAARVLWIVLPTLALIAAFGRWLPRLGVDEPTTILTQLAYGLGTPAFGYSGLFVGHQAAAWMVGLGLWCAWNGRSGGSRWRLAAGFLGGLAAITEYPTAPMLAGLTLLSAWRAERPWRGAAQVALGSALPLAVGAVYHTVAFGGPLTTGYPFVVHPGFQAMHREGLVGVGWPQADVAVALLVSLRRGLWVVAPALALAVLGAWPLRRGQGILAAVLGANVLLTLGVAAGFGHWVGGWSLGPRHLVSSLPAWTVLASWGFTRLGALPGGSAVVRGLVVAGMVGAGAAAFTYPGFPPEVEHPLWEQALPFLARGQLGYSLGGPLGWGPVAGMAPALLVWAGLGVAVAAGILPAHGRWRTHDGVWSWPRMAQATVGAWVALGFWLWLGSVDYPRTAQSLHRVTWLSAAVWEPVEARPQVDPRLLRWEQARDRVNRGRGTAEDYEALGAMAARLGRADEALAHYARAAWATRDPRPEAP